MASADSAFRLLVPLDGSDFSQQAIPYAMLQSGCDGEITLLAVNDVARFAGEVLGWPMPATEQDHSRADAGARDYLTAIGNKTLAGFDRWKREVRKGNPAEEIVNVAASDAASLIVMASHGRGSLGRWRYGSVADKVVQTSRMPVMLIRPGKAEHTAHPPSINRYVVALDGSERAERSLPIVAELASRSERPVHLVTVLAEAGVLLGAPWLGPPERLVERRELFAAARREITDSMFRHTADLSAAGLEATWSIQVGDTFEEIERMTSTDDVIALTSHGRSGIERWALGSLAEKLVRHSSSPVLVVNARTNQPF